MALKKHHKVMIGGASSLLIIFIVINSIFIYTLFVRQGTHYTALNQKIDDLETVTNTQISSISDNLISVEQGLTSLGVQIGSLDDDLTLLKASAGADFSGIIEDTVKSVVTIKTDISQGTGFIIEETGYIVTNAHVMEGANAAGIITHDGEIHNVALIGADSLMDIALLKIEGDYEKLTLADSDDIQVGESVIAIGNPYGLEFTVTQGIVSQIHRTGSNGLSAYIQIDAPLNPGNSGGPLINKQGKAIGINNFKIGSGESLGFALESNYVKNTVNEIATDSLGETLI